MMKPGPKPKLLDSAIRKRFCDAIRSGSTIELAAKYAGITPATYYTAIQHARNGEPEWAAFLDEVETAEGSAAVAMTAVIRKAATDGTWQAAAWMLERRYPKMYGRHDSRFAADPVPVPEYVEPADIVESLHLRIRETRKLRLAAETDGSHVAALTAMKLEADLAAQLTAELKARGDAEPPVSDADLVDAIAADVQALPPAVRSAVLSRLSAPVLRVVKAGNE